MKAILVPVDFSKCANNALVFALELAQRTGAGVHLLHVVFPNQGLDNNIYEAFWIDDYLAQKERALKALGKRIKSANPSLAAVPVTTQVSIGFPAPEIARKATEQGIDLIVMGTTGATGVRGIFLGSTAGGVISQTTIPLLITPAKATFRENINLVFATDFRIRLEEASLDILRSVVAAQKGFVKVMHVLGKPGEKADPSREATLAKKLQGIPLDFHYLDSREVSQAVGNFVDATDANALITISHQHTLLHRLFYESITHRLAYRVRVPMLVLHDAQ